MENLFNSFGQINKGLTHQKPGFAHGLLLILLAAVLSFLISPLGMIMSGLGEPFSKWITFISYTVTFGILLIIAKKLWDVSQYEQTKVNILVYIYLVPAIIALSIITEGIVSLLPMSEKIEKLFASMVQFNLPSYLTIGIMAPLLEEFIFRGIVLKRFLQRYDPWKAIVLSSVLFGLAHLNPWQFIAAFLMGMAIGWIYYKTQSVWPGIFVHFVNNTFSFYVAYKLQNVNASFFDLINNPLNYVALLSGCILVCYVVYLLLINAFNKQ